VALLHASQFYLGLVTTVLPTKTLAYTVPTGKRIIVRSIAVRNNSGSVTTSAYFFTTDILIWSVPLAGGGNAEFRPWLVLGPGDTLKAAVSVSSGVNFLMSGSLYDI
jgi:hypothetical protein